ncbi:MAG: hypothetical protein IJM33_00375 [Bacteroidales bacterium]|nr:hypothetical protein [Bacteroidales bacterium]
MEKNRLLRQAMPVLLSLFASVAGATEPGDSTDTYQNQTVSTDVFVQGRNTLTMSNVTVTPTGNLTANSPGSIVVNSPFKVQQGGTLKLNVNNQWCVIYDYDNSGNIIARHRH